MEKRNIPVHRVAPTGPASTLRGDASVPCPSETTEFRPFEGTRRNTGSTILGSSAQQKTTTTAPAAPGNLRVQTARPAQINKEHEQKEVATQSCEHGAPRMLIYLPRALSPSPIAPIPLPFSLKLA
ncbi:ORF3 [torque teno Delphinidae virus 7]